MFITYTMHLPVLIIASYIQYLMHNLNATMAIRQVIYKELLVFYRSNTKYTIAIFPPLKSFLRLRALICALPNALEYVINHLHENDVL